MQFLFLQILQKVAEGIIKKDSLQFFFVARGSLYELETQLYLSHDLQFLPGDDLSNILNNLETVRKLLNGFIRYYNSD